MTKCDACRDVAHVAVVGERFISYRCGRCALAIAEHFAMRGVRVQVNALVPARISPFVASDGSYHASDVDCREYQAALDLRATEFASRVARHVADLFGRAVQ